MGILRFQYGGPPDPKNNPPLFRGAGGVRFAWPEAISPETEEAPPEANPGGASPPEGEKDEEDVSEIKWPSAAP